MATDSDEFSAAQQAQFAALPEKKRARAMEIAREFAQIPDSPDSKSLLWTARRDAFALEKEALPETAAGERQADVMFLTVGMTHEPVVLSILAVRPKAAYLFHTDASEKTARQVAQDPDITRAGITCLKRRITEYDAPGNYQAMDRAWTDARKRYTHPRLAADPTAGTKMMVASLATWAFYHRVPITYLYCPAKQGVPIPFAGELVDVNNPYEAFADIEVEQICKFSELGFYDAGLQLCHSVLEQVRDMATAKRLELMREWLDICQQWDAFMHSHPDQDKMPDLAGRLEGLIADLGRFGLSDPDAKQRAENLQFLKGMPAPKKGATNVCDLHRLADLWAQAERRAAQAKYDDAVARLYRATEMALTVRLQDYGLKRTERPDWSAVKRETNKSFDQLHSEVDALPPDKSGEKPHLPRTYLGLAALASLLAVLDDDFKEKGYKVVRAKLGPDGAFNARNRSIQAHGTQPLEKQEYEHAKREVAYILRAVLGEDTHNEFKTLVGQARHAGPPISAG